MTGRPMERRRRGSFWVAGGCRAQALGVGCVRGGVTFNCETHDDVVRARSFSTFVLVVFRVVWSAGARAYAAHGTGPGDDDGRRWWSSAAARVHPVAREDDGRLRFCRVPDHTTPQLVANTAERARPCLAVALEKKALVSGGCLVNSRSFQKLRTDPPSKLILLGCKCKCKCSATINVACRRRATC